MSALPRPNPPGRPAMSAESVVLSMLGLFALIFAVPVYRSWRAARRRQDAAQEPDAGGKSSGGKGEE